MTTGEVPAASMEPTTLLSQPQLYSHHVGNPWPQCCGATDRAGGCAAGCASSTCKMQQVRLYLVCATAHVHVPSIAAAYLQLVSPTLPALSCRYEHEKGPADSPRSRGPSGWLIYQGSPHPP